MKKYLILFLILLIFPSILAINLNVEKQSLNEAMVLGLNEPAIFDLYIENQGVSDNFMIYTFFGSGYSPRSTFQINQNEIKNIKFTISPPYDSSRTGFMFFDYFIKASDGSEYPGQLTVELVELGEAFKIGSGEIDPESNSLEIYIQNKINFDFTNLNVNFSSAFFSLDETFALGPKETKKFDIILDKEDFKKLSAGFYNLNAKVLAGEEIANVDGIIEFSEKNMITTEVETYGFIIRTKVTTKSNEGNIAEIIQIDVEKNIFSRLFTSISPQPTNVDRKGFKITYNWNEDLGPGEVLKVKVRTNWFLPLIFIALIIAIVLFVKEYTKTNLKLRKRITFIKSKGGEFALKVSLLVHANKAIDNVLVIEKFPDLLKLYEKFGKEKPTKIDIKGKKAEWEFSRLEAGEKRVISYIVYSKVGVLGKFALPRATAIFEKEGNMSETQSNKVFFLAEQKNQGDE